MTYYGSKELARSFRTVRANTIKVAEEIPEEKYSFQPAPGTRTVAQTLVHIAIAPRMPKQVHIVEHRNTLVGFDFFSFMASCLGRFGLHLHALQELSYNLIQGLMNWILVSHV